MNKKCHQSNLKSKWYFGMGFKMMCDAKSNNKIQNRNRTKILGEPSHNLKIFFNTVFLSGLLLLSPQLANAEELKNFLLSCAYGTAAGAALGLSTVAFAEDPSSKTVNIAKGASLGLYAGMAIGWYMNYGPQKNYNSEVTSHSDKNWQPYLNLDPKNTQLGAVFRY